MAVIDKGATYDNVRGVFADLDDGGLTEDEALKQIRKIVGAKQPITALVLSGTLPFTLTIDLETGQIIEHEIDHHGFALNDGAETRTFGTPLDPELYAGEIARAKQIALSESWPDPEPM